MDFKSVNTAYLSDKEFADVQDDLNSFEYKSHLKVFKDHFGFRKGEVHTFVGTKGSGKSTWAKTILTELCYSERGVLLYVSEEDRQKYVMGLNRVFRLNNKINHDVKRYLENIIVLSELDENFATSDEFFSKIESIIMHADIEFLLFDNFTTSFLSELNINAQSAVLKRFKTIARNLNIPVVLFFHTSKHYDPKTLDGDSVRGSGTAINIGSYNYVIYQYKDLEIIRNFIYCEKARYHNKANKKLYETFYNYEAGIFTDCKYISMAEYKDIVSGK